MRTLVLVLLVACRHPIGTDFALPPISPAQASAPPASHAGASPTTPAVATRSAPAAAPTQAVAASALRPAGERFDEIVRGDSSTGCAAMRRRSTGAPVLEDTLARQPGQPEAMVWHGGATIARSVNAFRTGDRATGMALYTGHGR